MTLKNSSPPSNPVLLRAIQIVAKNDNPTTRQALYQALYQSQLLIPVFQAPTSVKTNATTTLSKDTPVQFITSRNSNGETLFLAFTDIQALLAWKKEGCPYVALSGPDLFSLALRNTTVASIIINPAGPMGGKITRREIQLLAEGSRPQQQSSNVSELEFSKGTEIKIGAPHQQPPESVIQQLRSGLAAYPEVATGYVFLMAAGQGAPHLVLGVQFSRSIDDNRLNEIFGDLSKKIQPLLNRNESFDFMVLQDADLLTAVQKAVRPIFRR